MHAQRLVDLPHQLGRHPAERTDDARGRDGPHLLRVRLRITIQPGGGGGKQHLDGSTHVTFDVTARR